MKCRQSGLRPRRRPPHTLLAWGLLLSLSLSAPIPARSQAVSGVAQFTEVYQRATVEFAGADFLKPAPSNVTNLAFTLAPLILQEAREEGAFGTSSNSFGTLTFSNGMPKVHTSWPAMYSSADTFQHNGKAYARMAYLWFYAGSAPGQTVAVQGIRITLDAAGSPVVWEVLSDHSGAELIFVAQSLEAAALAEFGKPLAGRRFSLERSRDEAPSVVVARVIDDGPVPMGPIVYIQAGTHDVSTLICRCMAAQARKLFRTSTYELQPLQVLPADRLKRAAREETRTPPAFWPGEPDSQSRLEKCLRLPGTF